MPALQRPRQDPRESKKITCGVCWSHSQICSWLQWLYLQTPVSLLTRSWPGRGALATMVSSCTRPLSSWCLELNNVSFTTYPKQRSLLPLRKKTLWTARLTAGKTDISLASLCSVYEMLNENKITMVSVYASNLFDMTFYEELTTLMLDLSDISLIIGGNFNAVWFNWRKRTVTQLWENRLMIVLSSIFGVLQIHLPENLPFSHHGIEHFPV